MQVAKWGNSLAVRIPADVARQLGLKEGDEIHLESLGNDRFAIVSENQRQRVVAESFREFRGMVPDDFAFDRDQIQSRDDDPA